jgi:hypothetical protein
MGIACFGYRYATVPAGTRLGDAPLVSQVTTRSRCNAATAPELKDTSAFCQPNSMP